MTPTDPLADPPEVVTRADLERLRVIRARRPWYAEGRDPDVEPAGDAAFLLDLVDRLLGRAALPDEELYPHEDDMPRYDVRSGPSLYMCGHGEWHVRARGRPGILASFTAGPLDAARLSRLVNEPLNDLDTPVDATGHALVTVARYAPASGSVYYRWRCSCGVNGEPLHDQVEARAAWIVHRDEAAP